MALRLIQITLPREVKWDVSGLVSEDDIVASWHDDSPHGHLVIHLLVLAAQAEPLIEQIEKRYGSSPDFRVILLPVEGVFPRMEQDTTPPGNFVEPAGSILGQRVCREELYTDATESSKITFSFLLLVALSAIVAAVGLTRDNLPVIIGAMVIAPLLGPNVSLAVGTTLGDLILVGRAIRTFIIEICIVVTIAAIIGVILTVDPEISAIARLTEVGYADVTIAFAAGAAGALAFTTGLSRAVIGVMVAVALLPPLCAFGLLLGSGHWDLSLDSLLLTATNIICINLAGVATFLVQGVKPTSWREAEKAKKAISVALALWITLLIVLVIILATR